MQKYLKKKKNLVRANTGIGKWGHNKAGASTVVGKSGTLGPRMPYKHW